MDVHLNLVAILEQLIDDLRAVSFKQFYDFSLFSTLDQPGSNHHGELLALQYDDAQV